MESNSKIFTPAKATIIRFGSESVITESIETPVDKWDNPWSVDFGGGSNE